VHNDNQRHSSRHLSPMRARAFSETTPRRRRMWIPAWPRSPPPTWTEWWSSPKRGTA